MDKTPPRRRLSAHERRSSILDAATSQFAERGYAGASTHQIAAAAGISQAYVVQTFGSKQQLFIEVLERVVDDIIAQFRIANDQLPKDCSTEDRVDALGGAFTALVADNHKLMSMLHAFILGYDPVIGPAGRRAFLKVYRFIREGAGLPAEDAMNFLARGMLISVLLGLRLPQHLGDDAAGDELMTEAFGDMIVVFKDDPKAG
ncbi:MAG: TetR/AcrR family transcriptional regulator [Antricoccus sp.]